ncbi:sugar ABC transporter substrate-binding protein [Christensenella sp. NSJ-35]|uniref:Sugar ABC transporter substrate-binding protein n=2 Tax=Christensenella tenuis TaxID=2763033 RepID=A0ABR7EH29_9FIRM|nr:sugar ABC transporter substrate-binding protein [Christensenella tenuis]
MAVIFAVVGCVACAAPAAEPETATESASAATGAEDTAAAEDGEGLVFGFTTITNSNEFMVKIQKGIEDKCAELGIEVICNDPDMDANKQISQVESFIAQGVDAIIMDPCDADASSPAVTKAQEAGIPIINVNSVTTAAPDVFVGSRDEESSELAIEFIAEKLGGKGNICMIHGNPGQSAEIKRSDGAYAVLEQYPDMTLLAEDTAHWSREEAMALTENWIQSYGDQINAIFSQNDEMVMGALKAAENNNMKENMIIVGVDAIPDALQAVKDGRLDATVFQDAYGQATMAVEMAYKMVKGEEVESETYVPFQLVTIDNVDNYLE